MSITVDPMRKFLHGLSKNMGREDLQEMLFLLKWPEGVSEKISNPLQLFTQLTKNHKSDDEIAIQLLELFSTIKREDLKEQVLEYVKGQQRPNSNPLESNHHDSLVKSPSFPMGEQRAGETITRCQSFQGSPQQNRTGESLMEKVHFSSAPNSPPEEQNTRPEPLRLLSDEKRSGELCSQLCTATPLGARSQSETRSQKGDRGQSEERMQSPDRSQERIHSAARSQSEDRMPSTDRDQSGDSIQSTDAASRMQSTDRGQSEDSTQSMHRSQSESRIQSVNPNQSKDSQFKSSQNEQKNYVGCASIRSQVEQRTPAHSLGMQGQISAASHVPHVSLDSPTAGRQIKESVDRTLTSPAGQLLPNSESETNLKELYVSNSESSPTISNSIGDGGNVNGSLITPEIPNTTFTAECYSESFDVESDGPQSTTQIPKSLVSILTGKFMCSDIEREMISVSPKIKTNSVEHMSTRTQSPKTQNSRIRAVFSQNFSNCTENTDQHLDPDPDQDRLGITSSTMSDDPDLDDMRPVPQGFYSNFLKKFQLRNGPKKPAETIIMRNYQKELAKPGLEGKNCIICAPTGSGKTLTAGYICQFQRMKAAVERRPFKALFIVCIRNLIMQQRDALSQIVLSEEDGSKRVGGLGETTLLSEYMKLYDVTVLTAQILVNCLRNGEVRMSDIDLLVMDECHHTTLNHPYSTIMLEYHRSRRENPSGKLPQVIGLTASLGVGPAGDDSMGALCHYIRLCANLDCTSITHVKDKEHLDELLLFNPKPQKDQIISVESRPTDNIFYQILDYMMTEIERITMFPLATASYPHGSQQYENWVIRQRLEAESKGLVDTILCTETLQRLNAAVMLYDELRACDAKRYLDAYFAEYFASQSRRPTSVLINRLYNDMRQEMEQVVVNEKLRDNAKLHRLCTLLTDLYSTNTEARGIILTKTRLSVEILVNCIKELSELRQLVYPAKLVGQGGKEGRMTDVEQENTLRRFRAGRDGGCNLLVATDVAQEGLDMPKCNFVIRYNFVSNEIGSVQSKGRARAPNSECYLIVNRNSINEKKEYENLEKEHMMLQALEDIDEVSEKELEEAIRKEQARIVEENEQKMLQKKVGAQLLDADNITIHCRYCKSELCRATDIRLRLNNYICIAEDRLLTKVFVKKLDRPDEYRLDSKTGLCFCNNRHCQKIIGAQLQYKQGVRKNGYVLSKQNVMWRYGNETDYRQIKKWSAVPFEIKEEKLLPDIGGL